MTVGETPTQLSLLSSSVEYCQGRVSERSLYGLLHREGARLFPDDSFADLFQTRGRRSIPPRIVATVMVLQRAEGLSDREAVERFSFDLRWKYAAGGLDYDHPGFVHTVLVDTRERLRRSERPNRIFEAVVEVCKEAGLVGQRRVMDSTALYDAVATQDTVTLIRSALRGVLRVAPPSMETELRGVLRRDDDYVAPGKPTCAWEDEEARLALVDALARDAHAALSHLEERVLGTEVSEALELLATVVGQDLEKDEQGRYRMVRGVAADRVISTVDPEARHGHKTSARGFDGYKGHVSIDPDTEVVVACDVTAGNVSDGQGAKGLLEEVFLAQEDASRDGQNAMEVYGDACYGTADIVEKLEESGIEANVKVAQPSPKKKGLFCKRAFAVDLQAQTVRCPQGVVVAIKTHRTTGTHESMASFGKHCDGCPLRAQCTDSKTGRKVRIHPKEAVLQRSRARQEAEDWKAQYRAIRPKVERKIAHLMQKRHGGRRARMRGCLRVMHDFALLCAATNLKRLATLGLRHTGAAWRAFARAFAQLLLLLTPQPLRDELHQRLRPSQTPSGLALTWYRFAPRSY